MIRPVFHLCAAAINGFTILYDQLYIVIPMPAKELVDLPFQARCMFLTFWCLVMQMLYFIIAFLNDMFGTDLQEPKRAPLVRKIKDTLFSIAFPVAIYVSLAFWLIYNIDKEMVFPEEIERRYPKWMNHVMHTTIAIFITIEFVSSYQNYPSRRTGFAIMTAFNCSYTLWLFLIYMKTSVWVYPMFKHLNWTARILFVIMSLLVALGFYILGEKSNQILCGSPSKTTAKNKNR